MGNPRGSKLPGGNPLTEPGLADLNAGAKLVPKSERAR